MEGVEDDTTSPPHRVNATVELKQAETEKGIDWPAWIQAISPILLALVGLYFTDTVRMGFERQQLQLANASGMQGLLVQLLGDKVSQTEARAAASTLAAFGPPAVAPLVTALADADDVRTPAIEGALRAIGLNAPEAVCGPLLSMLEHQTGRYSWLMHRSAIRVIGARHLALEAQPFYEFYYGNPALRGTLEGRVYRAFGEEEDFVLAGRAKVGSFVGPDVAESPPDLLFFAGGGGSVRGYAYQSIGVETTDAEGDTFVAGGKGLVEASGELRYRINESFGAVGFVLGRLLEGEFLRNAKTINKMVEQLGNFSAEVTRVAREVGTEGKLGGQAKVKGVAGVWKDLTDNVNSMAGNLTSQVRNIADVTKAVAAGDLSKKITVDVKGELAELKNTINTMVDQLRSFAAEVTRVAREVGTERLENVAPRVAARHQPVDEQERRAGAELADVNAHRGERA